MTHARRAGASALLAALTFLVCTGGPAAAHADSSRAQSRVVGGAPAAIATAPYQVALWDPTVNDGSTASGSPYLGQFCGGVILDATHVLTAAHCVQLEDADHTPKTPATVHVLAGTAHLRNTAQPADPGEVDATPSAIAVNPNYNPSTQSLDGYDVAVLTLAQPLYAGSPPLNGTTSIAPIALGTTTPTAGQALRLTGWGDTNTEPGNNDPSPQYPQDLQTATLPAVDTASCAATYSHIGLSIGTHTICAGGAGTDACYGDSGGPLTQLTGTTTTLAGVVDAGYGCGQPGYPGVYANVTDPTIAGFIRSATTGTTAPATPPASPGLPATGTTSTTAPTTPPQTTATVPDRIRPATRIVSHSCSKTRCAVNAQVTDPPPSAGILRVDATLRWTTTKKCRRHGKTTTCKTTKTKRLTARSIGGGHFAVIASRLARHRTHTLTLIAHDRAGHRQLHATVVRLRTR